VAIGLHNPVSHVNNIYAHRHRHRDRDRDTQRERERERERCYLLHCCAKTLVPKRWWNEEIVKLTKGMWVGGLLQMVHNDPPGGFG
jgi:hypothetical protein